MSALHARSVLATRHRPGAGTGAHPTTRQPVLATVRTDFGATLIELTGEDDHVHVLVEYPPTVQLSKLANSLKGVSSRRLRPRFRRRTYRDHPWSPSYSAASCGGAPLATLRQHVDQQRRPTSAPSPTPPLQAERPSRP